MDQALFRTNHAYDPYINKYRTRFLVLKPALQEDVWMYGDEKWNKILLRYMRKN